MDTLARMARLLVQLAVAIFSFTASQGVKYLNSYAGAYKLYVVRFIVCSLSEYDGTSPMFLKVSHFNPAKPMARQTITGNVTVPFPRDDTHWVHVTVAIRSNNQWKPNFFDVRLPSACSSFRSNWPSFYEAMYKQNASDKGPCRVEKGVYYVNDAPVDWEFPNVRVAPYGHWMFRSVIGRPNQRPFYCMKAEVKTIPRI